MTGVVVLTGAAGFVGTHTAQALLDVGYEVVGVDAFTPFYPVAEKRANAASLTARPGFRLVEGDLLRLDLSPLLRQAPAVVHLAAQPGVTGSWGSPFATYARHNILATQRLLEGCVRAGVRRLVFASSSSVYGDAPAYPCAEDVPPRPVSPYGVTKLAAEHLCLAYARPEVGDLTVAVVRLFTVYGPRQRPDMALRRFLEAALTGGSVTVFGDGNQTRDFTYVSDAVSAILHALKAPLRAEVFNVGGGSRVSVKAVVELTEYVTGGRVRLVHGPPRAGEVRHTGADCGKAARLLGYRPSVDLATGLAAEAEWLARLLACPAAASVGAAAVEAPG